MVFIKLVVLILVCGSSGIGLLSVRQSRLQAAHEMAEARHRVRRLDERAGEIRTQIAMESSPARVMELIRSQPGYGPAVFHPAKIAMTHQMGGQAADPLAGQMVGQIDEPSAHSIFEQTIANPEVVGQAITNADEQLNPVQSGLRAELVDNQHIWILDDGSRVIFVNN